MKKHKTLRYIITHTPSGDIDKCPFLFSLRYLNVSGQRAHSVCIQQPHDMAADGTQTIANQKRGGEWDKGRCISERTQKNGWVNVNEDE